MKSASTMGVIRYKIWYDLWENKGRTLRVVAIIAIGAFALGTVWGAKEFILKDVTRIWQASAPATIGLEVKPAVDDARLVSLENLPGVETVEGWYQSKTVRWRRHPAEPWQPAILVALEDYEIQTLRQVKLDSGAWPRRKLMSVQRGRGSPQRHVGDHFGGTKYERTERHDFDYRHQRQARLPAGQAFGRIV